MLLLFWGITPFQNAVIGQTVLSQTQDVNYTRTSGLIPVQQQPKALSAEFFYTAYNIAWLKLQPPPFMTLTAAYDTARPETSEHHINESWSFPSKEYSATLECVAGVSQGNYTVSDGRGCFYDIPSLAMLDQYATKPLLLAALAGQDLRENHGITDQKLNGECTIGRRQTLTLVSARRALENGTSPTITTLFCNPKYVFYHANITTTPEGVILSSSQTSPALNIPLAVFNYSFFEKVLVSEVSPYGSMNTNFPVDIPPRILEPDVLELYGLTQTQYGLALGPANYTEYLNPPVLQQVFESAHNLLFISAFHSLNSQPTAKETIKGSVTAPQQAITIVQSFAIMLEAFLILIIVLGVLLLHFCWSRETNLKSDPSSLTHTMAIISESTTLLHAVAIQRDMDKMELGLRNHYFKLGHWTRGAPYRLDRSRAKEEAIDLIAQGQKNFLQRIKPAMNYGVESSIGLGCLFCAFIMVVLGTVIYFWKHARNDQG